MIQPTIKYLGLTLDSRWTFDAHFRVLIPRLLKTSAALGRIMPNCDGTSTMSRRLYTGVVRSMALYGAPVWEDALTARNRALLRRPQRAMAVRVIRGYRTVSFEAATILAGQIPWDLEARVISLVYRWCSEKRRRGEIPLQRAIERKRVRVRRLAMAEWLRRLEEPSAGIRTVEAVRPCLDLWVGRRHGCLTYRLTQVLTGHGCFGKYLCQVARREPDTRCHHCGHNIDTAYHTLVECPAWHEERQELINAIGRDLSLPVVCDQMCRREETWSVVVSFCERVIARKESAERQREEDANAVPARRRRIGRRRRADVAHFHPP